ncbi:MAG: aldo/keto reductase [Candidatus Dormibacteraeota bacterium]|nr:aldo/keto reductase [Candidatus Dormibacteraeota bacterium]
MEYVHLGRSGLMVSRLCLGTMNFGTRTEAQAAHRIMDSALEMGINFFDTANVYGRAVRIGLTEEVVGEWLSQGDHRQRVVLATKVFARTSDGPNEGGLSARHIISACEASLRRLRTDHIDLYQMHHVDRATPVDETLEALELLRQQGKVIYFGSSNFAGWHLARFQEHARTRGAQGLVSEQSLYNLLSREVELEVLPACREYGIGMIPWSPLASGILGGTAGADQGGRRSDAQTKNRGDKHRDQLAAYERLCQEVGSPPSEVALAWLLAQPGVTAPIIGPRTSDQLTQAARCLELELGDAELTRLDQIFPGPGGAAPEAYAW